MNVKNIGKIFKIIFIKNGKILIQKKRIFRENFLKTQREKQKVVYCIGKFYWIGKLNMKDSERLRNN